MARAGQHVEVAVDDEHGAVVGELTPVVGSTEECQQPALRKVLEAVVDALMRAYDELEAIGVAEGAHAVRTKLHGVGAARIRQHALEAVAVSGVGPEDVVEQPADAAGGTHVDLGEAGRVRCGWCGW